MSLDESKVKEIFETNLKPVVVELGHFSEALQAINKQLEKLPCDSIVADLKELKTRFEMRVAEFEKTAEERKVSIDAAWVKIRNMESRPPLKGDVEKLQEKIDKDRAVKETRLYGLLLLTLTLYLKYGAS